MIDGVSVNSENLVIDTGGGSVPSPPPSPPASTSSSSSQAAAEVVLSASAETAKLQDVKKEERVTSSSKDQEQNERDLDERLTETIDALNEKLSRLNREVQFKVDKRINKNYISVIDKSSKEIIREFPPKEIRTFIARFDEFIEQLDSSSDVKSLIINLEV